jgi:hypothetical protein
MTLKSQIEIAKDAIGEALIIALQEKNETAIGNLFDAYNKVVQIKITETNKTTFTISGNNNMAGFHDGYINFGAGTSKIISTGVEDAITFTSNGLD